METINEINDIIKGKHNYLNSKTEIKTVGNVLIIGDLGYTSSIGQWIHIVNKLLPVSQIDEVRIWESINSIEKKQKNIYYGIHVKECNDVCYKNRWVICGGATDYSGEGSHGRKLAEEFMHLCSLDKEVFVQPVDDLLRLFGEVIIFL